jgi:hypothetical protein
VATANKCHLAFQEIAKEILYGLLFLGPLSVNVHSTLISGMFVDLDSVAQMM